jgi:hypothetical protein
VITAVPVVLALAHFFLREGPGCCGHPVFPIGVKFNLVCWNRL